MLMVLKSLVGAYVRGGRMVRGYANQRMAHEAQGDLFADAPKKAEAEAGLEPGERINSVHTDARGRDPSGLKECTACHYPHKGAHCDNPACKANPTSNKASIAKQEAEHERRQADEAERARIREIQAKAARPKPEPRIALSKPTAETLPAGHTRKHYATVIRNGGTPHQQVGWLAGPFDTNDEAKGHVEAARKKASEIDPRADFDAFGTSSRVAAEHPPGVLNGHLGIDAAAGPRKTEPMSADGSSKAKNPAKRPGAGGGFDTVDDALAYAEDSVKEHRDPLDGIEVHKVGKRFHVYHTMNSSGRDWARDRGGRHLGTVYQNEPSDHIRDKADMEHVVIKAGQTWRGTKHFEDAHFYVSPAYRDQLLKEGIAREPTDAERKRGY